jgi:hypothetical protein
VRRRRGDWLVLQRIRKRARAKPAAFCFCEWRAARHEACFSTLRRDPRENKTRPCASRRKPNPSESLTGGHGCNFVFELSNSKCYGAQATLADRAAKFYTFQPKFDEKMGVLA